MKPSLLIGGAFFVFAISTLPFLVIDGARGQDRKPAEKGPAAEIEKLIKLLGSDNAKAREAASTALLKIGEEALPFLKAAMKAEDVELRRRAETLHAQLFAFAEEKRIARQIVKANEFGIDTFVERVLANREKMTKEDWETFAGISQMLELEGKANGSKVVHEIKFLDLPIVTKKAILPEEGLITKKRVIAESVVTKQFGIQYSLVVARDCANGSNFDTYYSAIFTSGKFEEKSSPSNCIVVCAGDFERERVDIDTVICGKNVKVKTQVVWSYIVCFGDVEIAGDLRNSTVVAYGNVTIKGDASSKIRAYGDVTINGYCYAEVQAKGKVTLNPANEKLKKSGFSKYSVKKLDGNINFPIQFFTPKLLGIGLDMENKRASVTSVDVGSVLQKAGVKNNDQILLVNGKGFKNLGELTVLMRRGTAEQALTLAVNRGKETLDLKITFQR